MIITADESVAGSEVLKRTVESFTMRFANQFAAFPHDLSAIVSEVAFGEVGSLGDGRSRRSQRFLSPRTSADANVTG
jgi:hypothetical protein